ncbi:MAG: hydroxyacid dehydrogenase [Clostridia bacterium]|nr:hydroxyacid dehydrogenase [Clostridia bacterium]
MKILITPPDNRTFSRYFPVEVLERLKDFGEVERNPFDRSFTAEELRGRAAGADILLTHWGTPRIDGSILENARRLRLVAHAAGSVAGVASEELYRRDIPVISANSVMARYVAESVLGYMIAGTHRFIQTDAILRSGGWNKLEDRQSSIFGARIGLIGLGTVGRALLDLLAPFGCRVYIYDPYLPRDALGKWDFAQLCDFETAMKNPIVSVHASRTPETCRMIGREALALLPFGALLINSARGSIIDTGALLDALREKRIYAVLDVYEKEGAGNIGKELPEMTEVTMLQPHAAAVAAGARMTFAVAEDIGRFVRGEELRLRVSYSQFRLMTREC